MISINEMLTSMSLEEKIYQMVCVRYVDFSSVRELSRRGIVGSIDTGIIVKNSAPGLEGTISLINELMKESKNLWLWVPPYNGISYFGFGTSFPTMMALGATNSSQLAYKMGKAIASECKALGGTLIGSLILDINSNPDNPIINTRAMSDSPDLIIKLASFYLKGTQEAGVIDVGHHFPGHGDTSSDSHIVMPTIEHKKEFLMRRELFTFNEVIKKGLWGILSAHIVYPALSDPSEGRIAATISKSIITGLLKNEMGFKGLVVSDSLAMKGIADKYETGRLATLTIKAGHDVILPNYREHPQISVDAIIKAVDAGEIDIEQINNSVLKILSFRERLNTLNIKSINLETAKSIIGCNEHISIAKEVADKSITLLENESIEFSQDSNRKVLIIAVKDEEDGKIVKDMGTIIKSKANYLFESCKKYCSHADIKLIGSKPDKEEIEMSLSMAKDYDIVLYGVFTRVVAYKEGSSIISDEQAEFINALSKHIKCSVIAVFGNPYVLKKIDKPQNCLCAYSECDYSIESCLKVIFGKIKATGKLPVNINERYVFGYGI